MKDKKYVLLGLFGAILVLVGIINTTSILKPLEETLLDTKFRTFQRSVPEQDVALLMIDERSMNEMRDNLGIYWPWPREIYSYVHNYLSSKGAKLLVYDIILDQPDFNRPGFVGTQSDRSFEVSLQTYNNGVLGLFTNEYRGGDTITLEGLKTNSISNFPHDKRYEIANPPIPSLASAAANIGSVTIPRSDESLIRSIPLFFNTEGDDYLPSLSMASYLSTLEKDVSISYEENILKVGDNRIPLTKDHQYLVNWYKQGGGGLDGGSFTNYSFVSVLSNAIQFAQTGVDPDSNFIQVKDKVVLIGASAAGLADIKSTPMSPLEPFPGVEIYATVIQNIINADYLTVLNNSSGLYRVIMGFILLCLCISILYTSYRWNILLSVLFLVGTTAIGLLLFSVYRIWLPTLESLVFVSIAIGGSFITKYVTEDREKRKIRSAFGRYVQKELVDKISDNPSMLKLGGERKELTIIFSDLEGFTGISEKYSAEELVIFLNEYLTEMTNIVFQQNGTLDKYIGDAIMAFWGAPVDNDDHAYNACMCVVEMQKAMVKLHNKWDAEGKPVPQVRFGVNTGEAIVGNMGSQDRFDYTVIGDQVNLAARLEPANKEFGTKVLISESTFIKVKERFICREAGKIKAKGKEEIIRVYELIDVADDSKTKKLESFLNEYEEALKLYYNKDFDGATTAFMEVQKKYGHDELSETYLSRIAHYQAFPPVGEWSGIHEQISK